MDENWKIEYYMTLSGHSPVEEFILKLSVKAQTKLSIIFGLLKEFGVNIGMPHSKKVIGTPLWELRILGEDSIRILYITQTDKVFLLLHAFQKKKQNTDKKEIKIALERLFDYKLRTQN